MVDGLLGTVSSGIVGSLGCCPWLLWLRSSDDLLSVESSCDESAPIAFCRVFSMRSDLLWCTESLGCLYPGGLRHWFVVVMKSRMKFWNVDVSGCSGGLSWCWLGGCSNESSPFVFGRCALNVVWSVARWLLSLLNSVTCGESESLVLVPGMLWIACPPGRLLDADSSCEDSSSFACVCWVVVACSVVMSVVLQGLWLESESPDDSESLDCGVFAGRWL